MFKNPFSKNSKRARADKYNTEGNALGEAGDSEAAIPLYLKAAEIDPSWSVPAYNLGLHYKNLAQWKESLKWCQLAHELDPDDEAATWNMGIAATALRQWDIARRAWKAYGIDIPEGEGEVDFPCGTTPVRLHPNGEAEVVWAQRLDPARARILNIPFPESGFRYGDIVINDGAAVGYRKSGDREVPVFNVLGLWEHSEYGPLPLRSTSAMRSQTSGTWKRRLRRWMPKSKTGRPTSRSSARPAARVVRTRSTTGNAGSRKGLTASR